MKPTLAVARTCLKSFWQAVGRPWLSLLRWLFAFDYLRCASVSLPSSPLRPTLTALLLAPLAVFAQGTINFSTFRCDVTPPVGAPLCAGLVKPVAGVSEPLLALGVVILGADKPIVLCAVDWCEIRGADHVHWCEQLARAAGTTPDHVAVQSLHQHDAPIGDSTAHGILAGAAHVIDVAWADRALAGVVGSVEASLKNLSRVTHITQGEAKVEHVAWDHTGRFMAVGNVGEVTVWDYSGRGPQGTRPTQLDGHDRHVSALAFQHRGGLLASGGADGLVMVWDPPKRSAPLHSVELSEGVASAAWGANDQFLLVGTELGQVLRFDLPT